MVKIISIVVRLFRGDFNLLRIFLLKWFRLEYAGMLFIVYLFSGRLNFHLNFVLSGE
jgi:hypothetical protein